MTVPVDSSAFASAASPIRPFLPDRLQSLTRSPSMLTLAASLGTLLVAQTLAGPWTRLAMTLMAGVLLAALALRRTAAALAAGRRAGRRAAAAAALADASDVALLADGRGRVLARSPAAPAVASVAEALGPRVADAAGLAAALGASALRHGTAFDAPPTRREPGAIHARRIDRDTLLWRVAPGAAPAPSLPLDEDWPTLDRLPIPLLRLSPDGVVLAANRHARTLLTVPDPGTSRLSDLLEGMGRPVSEWVADASGGRPSSGPQVLTGTGANRDTILRVTLTPEGEGEGARITALLEDVTELKSLEAQFVQSQKMQALGHLAGGIAHDFNNLLTAITGHSDLLLQRHDPTEADYADLIQIRQNVNRAAGLVGQLLAFSRKTPMLPEPLDLRVVLSDLTHLLNRLVGERVRLVFDHEPTLRLVRADKRHLEQVIVNLVVNARDAMPEGGAIRIVTEDVTLDRPLQRDRASVAPGDYAVVRVIDQGTGIPAERLPLIFDPFYTTKRQGEGTGLGLSTVYGLVKQAGGFVFVDSEPGHGSTFAIWLPAHGQARARARDPVAAAPPPAPSPARARPARILLVEDETGVRAFAARALRLRGHAVDEAASGEEAIARLSDGAYRPDLILTDVILPDLDGPAWVREALAGREGTQVVFMSGYAEETFAEQKALIEGSAFLPKPFSLSDLVDLVERNLPVR